MRIGVFTDSYRPYVSGVVRSIEMFQTELQALGHQMFIFAPGYPRHFQREGNVFRFLSLPAPSHDEFRLALPFSLRLGGTVQSLGLDVIHTHSPFLMGRLGARAAKLHRLPLVFTYHTFYHRYVHYVPMGRSISEGLVTAWTRNYCNQCDAVIAPTPSVHDFLARLGVEVPVKVIPTGIYPERFQGGDPSWLRRAFAVADGQPVLLFCGRLAKEKNIGFLLRSFRSLVGRLPESVLVIVGDGPAAAEVKALAETMGVAGNVRFTGRLADRDICNAYAGADVFVFPSVTETQGLVLAEAMAAGLPVIAVDAPGSRDTIVDGVHGFLCKPQEDSFVQAMERVLQDKDLRRRMAAAARQRAEAFSVRRMARLLADLYQELMMTRRRVISGFSGGCQA